MPISTVWILKYIQQCYVKWFWTISSLGAPDTIIQHLNNWCPRLILFKYLVVYGGGAVSPILLSSSLLKLPQPVLSICLESLHVTDRKKIILKILIGFKELNSSLPRSKDEVHNSHWWKKLDLRPVYCVSVTGQK